MAWKESNRPLDTNKGPLRVKVLNPVIPQPPWEMITFAGSRIERSNFVGSRDS